MALQRIFLFFSEFAALNGKSQRQNYRDWVTMRAALGKSPGQKITLREFARYEGIRYEDLLLDLNRQKTA